MAAVILDDISKLYPPHVRALQNFTLHIEDSEFIVLVGPSGCGKTTTLRLIAGLERLTSGSISIGGRAVDRLAPRQRDVAMVFQRHTLYPHLTVRRNLSFGMEMRQGFFARRAGDDIATRVAEAAKLLELEDLLDRRADQLSGGQQQRVALGRALVRQPAVFLLDEPLSHLDARLRGEMRRELHLLHKRLPATMLYVTHDPVEAMTLADRVVVLDGGVVQQVDRPQVVYDRPVNRTVAAFFGWPPMNLVDGMIVQEDGRRCFAAKGRTLVLPVDREPETRERMTLGIRPEDLSLRPRGDDGTAVAMRIETVELLGHSSLVTVKRGAIALTVLVPARQAWAEGQDVDVVFDMNRTHWFDGVTGMTIRPQGRIA